MLRWWLHAFAFCVPFSFFFFFLQAGVDCVPYCLLDLTLAVVLLVQVCGENSAPFGYFFGPFGFLLECSSICIAGVEIFAGTSLLSLFLLTLPSRKRVLVLLRPDRFHSLVPALC